MRAKRVTHDDGSLYGIRWDCPGCGAAHIVPTTGPKGWTWNGDIDRPTLSPSILVHPHGELGDDGSIAQTPLCHSFLRDGRLEFLRDCTHDLAGKTVELPELPQ